VAIGKVVFPLAIAYRYISFIQIETSSSKEMQTEPTSSPLDIEPVDINDITLDDIISSIRESRERERQ